MSDLSLQLQPAASQLPVSSYFDPALYALEMQQLFREGPRYVGHSLAVPEVGGALVGGASLKAADFLGIVRGA